MDIQQMQSALAVARFKSFSKAADHTTFTQSAVSKHVTALEAELGVEIFERRVSPVSVMPTELGEDILKRLDQIVSEYNELCLMARNTTLHKQSPISLGSAPALGSYGEDLLMAEFAVRYPELTCWHLMGGSVWITELLRSSRIDCAVMAVGSTLWSEEKFSAYIRKNDCVAVPLLRNRLTIGVSADHRLARQESVSLADLKDETFLLRIQPQSPEMSFYPAKHENLFELCRKAGFEPKVQIIDDYSGKVRPHLIARGVGILPNTSHITTPYENVRFVPVEPQPYPITSWFVALRRNESPTLQSMLELARGMSRENGFTHQDER